MGNMRPNLQRLKVAKRQLTQKESARARRMIREQSTRCPALHRPPQMKTHQEVHEEQQNIQQCLKQTGLDKERMSNSASPHTITTL